VVVAGGRRPPVILVHGAANSAGVWRYWQDALAERGWSSHALDLRGHTARTTTDLSTVSMTQYADDVVALARELRRAPALVGWSMGGLVAMMAARQAGAWACVGLAPSTPATSRNDAVPLRQGIFGAEEYGIEGRDPNDQPMMPDLDRDERERALSSLAPESRYARDERKAGIVIRRLSSPLLIVTGSADSQWPRAKYSGLQLPFDHVDISGASHWGLVLNRRLLPEMVSTVTNWLEKRLAESRRPQQGS
jgi:pimeloyl-ACP methyl ester carboxylesterase